MIGKEILMSLGANQATAERWVPHLNRTMQKYDISTPRRQAMFLSQLAHESGTFQFVSENLNYSAEALLRVFPKYFPTLEEAQKYERQPLRIANRVYANRMGNRDESTGDGWKYRGRGLIQLTGKDNYASYSMQEDNMALLDPDIVTQPEHATDSAGWFWKTNRLNQIADTGDVRAVTRRINGGYNGLSDRESKYEKLIVLLGED